MRLLSTVWNEAQSFDLDYKLEELAARLIERIGTKSGVSPDIYDAEIYDDGGGDYVFAIKPLAGLEHSAPLKELRIYIGSYHQDVEIALLQINDKGKGLGKSIIADLLLSLKEMGYSKFYLDAQNMGPDFWPQFGFVPKEQSLLKRQYTERFEILKPYMPPLVQGMIGFNLRDFDSSVPYKFSQLRMDHNVRDMFEDKNFLKTFAIYGGPDEVATLSRQFKELHYIIKGMIEAGRYKMGTLLNKDIASDMTLDLENPEQRGILNATIMKMYRQSAAQNLCKNNLV